MAGEASKEQVDKAWKFCQSCLRANPVLIIGSGASVPYGLPTMWDLGKALVESIEKENPDVVQNEKWQSFKAKLEEVGLEQAIDSADIWRDETLYSAIKIHTWYHIVGRDSLIQKLVLDNNDALALSKLIRYLFTSDNHLVQAVTPNYDRLIEYACEAAEVLWRTNFQHGYMGAWRGDKPAIEFWNNGKKVPEKTLELWKVHGSLDWFSFEKAGIRSVPCTNDLPAGASPLIVPPSIKKMTETHDDPFRKIMHEVDNVLCEANAFFCIGYGFNDSHIQAKLFDRARRDRKPVLIIAKKLTETARKLFLEDGEQIEYLAFEEAGNNGTMMYDKENKEGLLIEGQHVWNLAHFVNEVI